ncbi:MAG: hypothetical protein ACP5I6_01335 [Caldisphaera sp.]|jgi:hypothetical protein|nr:hypothetical protein [Caldisphaera sp.]PMP91341.1 MAG: hypothetical protein C0171_02915 [Caldisphaera sp.]
MPRVDSKYYALDISSIYNMDESKVDKLIEWSITEKPIFITNPSIIIIGIKTKKVRYALGIGSLVSEVQFPFEGLKVANSDWVDGCNVGNKEPYFLIAKGSSFIFSGKIIGLDNKDPISLLMNGLKANLSIINETNRIPLVTINNDKSFYPVISLKGNNYMLHVVDKSNIAVTYKYALKLYTSC